MSIEESLIDNNEDSEEEEGCESCGFPLYPHTRVFDDGKEDNVTYLRCNNSECKEYHKLIEI